MKGDAPFHVSIYVREDILCKVYSTLQSQSDNPVCQHQRRAYARAIRIRRILEPTAAHQLTKFGRAVLSEEETVNRNMQIVVALIVVVMIIFFGYRYFSSSAPAPSTAAVPAAPAPAPKP
jgi:hypothetical protein